MLINSKLQFFILKKVDYLLRRFNVVCGSLSRSTRMVTPLAIGIERLKSRCAALCSRRVSESQKNSGNRFSNNRIFFDMKNAGHGHYYKPCNWWFPSRFSSVTLTALILRLGFWESNRASGDHQHRSGRLCNPRNALLAPRLWFPLATMR